MWVRVWVWKCERDEAMCNTSNFIPPPHAWPKGICRVLVEQHRSFEKPEDTAPDGLALWRRAWWTQVTGLGEYQLLFHWTSSTAPHLVLPQIVCFFCSCLQTVLSCAFFLCWILPCAAWKYWCELALFEIFSSCGERYAGASKHALVSCSPYTFMECEGSQISETFLCGTESRKRNFTRKGPDVCGHNDCKDFLCSFIGFVVLNFVPGSLCVMS